MGLHHNQRPTGNTRLLLSQFSGAAAAYSLRLLSGFTGGKVVRVRRSSDNSERDFTSREIDNGTLEQWVNAQEVAPADYGDGAVAAYSLRYVSDSYSGPVVRVRRESDNTEQDFAPTEIESGSLESFCGSGDGLVTTWYDQSGSGNDATQTTASDQPRIVSNGSLFLMNGYPALSDGRLTASYDVDISNLSSFLVADLSTAPSDNFAVVLLGGSTDNRRWYAPFQEASTGKYDFFHGEDDFGDRLSPPQTSSIWTMIADGTSVISYINGNTNASVSTQRSGVPVGDRSISPPVSGAAEVIVYTSDQFSNRVSIETDINSYYQIYEGDNEGHVTTWYDQSGNGNDATQTTASEQPRIVSGGVLVTENGRPALDFDGVDDILISNKSVSSSFSGEDKAFSSFLTATSASVSGNTVPFSMSVDDSGNPRFIPNLLASGNVSIFIRDNSDISASFSLNDVTYSVDETLLISALSNGNLLNYRKNSEVITENDSYDIGDVTLNQFGIGADQRRNDIVSYLNGTIQEIILYPSDQSSNRELIETNINNHYGIY